MDASRVYGSRAPGSARTPPASVSVNTPTGLRLSPSWWSAVQPFLPLCAGQLRSGPRSCRACCTARPWSPRSPCPRRRPPRPGGSRRGSAAADGRRRRGCVRVSGRRCAGGCRPRRPCRPLAVSARRRSLPQDVRRTPQAATATVRTAPLHASAMVAPVRGTRARHPSLSRSAPILYGAGGKPFAFGPRCEANLSRFASRRSRFPVRRPERRAAAPTPLATSCRFATFRIPTRACRTPARVPDSCGGSAGTSSAVSSSPWPGACCTSCPSRALPFCVGFAVAGRASTAPAAGSPWPAG